LDFKAFESWLAHLGEADRKYLQKNTAWNKEYQKAKKDRSLPHRFVERTMETLEGGSESET